MTQSGVTWEQSLGEGLSRSGWGANGSRPHTLLPFSPCVSRPVSDWQLKLTLGDKSFFGHAGTGRISYTGSQSKAVWGHL